MERYIYLCNDKELTKLIEAFKEKLQKNENENEDVFYSDSYSTYALKEKVELNEVAIQNLVGKLANKFTWTSLDIIYVSVHPGGTSENEIKKQLHAINNSLKSKEGNNKILVTYHGSQNKGASDFFTKENVSKADIVELNKGVTNFILPNIIPILKDFNSRFLSELSLFKQFIGNYKDKAEDTIKLNNESVKTLKTIYGLDGDDELIKEKFGGYYSALEKVINKYNEFYSLLKNPEKTKRNKTDAD